MTISISVIITVREVVTENEWGKKCSHRKEDDFTTVKQNYYRDAVAIITTSPTDFLNSLSKVLNLSMSQLCMGKAEVKILNLIGMLQV